eukprot:CAMPEP_0177758314 /NCGR_PEP_ID=MMETSP0491_2-20121128/4118_1 /TAXON_ID=63592 /ORGANISM="Tetraselmis chuii, Strain PLY429" /LENGTH=252 /DNA_ID=CAMNT_0019274039 /DNA_START=51 /DNA_END=810 /DNA_ORIENTATION=+
MNSSLLNPLALAAGAATRRHHVSTVVLRTPSGRRQSRIGTGVRSPGSGRLSRGLKVSASAKSQDLIDEGKALVTAGNRMAAIRVFEESLGEGPTSAQKQESLYSIMVCHASFGDVELAQITLREALQAGLTLDAALSNPDYMPFTASKQAQIQLRKFAEIYSKSVEKAAAAGKGKRSNAGAAAQRKKTVQELLGTKDVSTMTSTTLTGIDTSVGGILIRVAVLLVFLILFGIAAYFIGLDYVLQVPEMDLSQ